MKKIFTLLFCVAALAMTANAADNAVVDNYVKMLLNGDASAAMLRSPNVDFNHDGVFNIGDVTAMIDAMLNENQPEMAPAQEAPQADINGMMKDAINADPRTTTTQDVTKAIDQQKKEK